MSTDDVIQIPLDGPNPYEAPLVASATAAALAGPGEQASAPPRIWTVFLSMGATLCAIIAAQIVAAIVLVGALLTSGESVTQDSLVEFVSNPAVFLGLGVFSQLTILSVALAAAWCSPWPMGRRLNLRRPDFSAWQCSVLIAGSIVPFVVGMGLAHLLLLWIPPDPSIAKLYSKITPAWALPFLLFIALAPGFAEELLFRGYMQSRLTQRSGPAWAWLPILGVSALFGLVHLMPHTVVFAFVMGLWLGLIAWRTGSVWPGIVCHALVNGLWNVWNLGERFGYFPETPHVAFLIGLGGLGLAAFGWSLWLVFRREPAATDIPASPAAPMP